ncbi:MAG: hypothetical protein NT062_35465 [Proteobacteria bacterium]|nr:hypothetical protein [Pseudomonadota bacterium]
MAIESTPTRALPPSLVDANAVDLTALRKQLRVLATLEASTAPMVSCYVSVEHGVVRREVITRRARAIRATLPAGQRGELDATMARGHAQLEQRSERTRGMAVFARGGEAPYLQALEFRVPLSELLVFDHGPVIYPLVELKDTFHRFVVLISTEASARILEVSLGAVTREIWTTAPVLPDDVRRQWSQDHYQNHRQDRMDRFLKEKLDLLDRLMSAKGHTHLVVAGTPRLTARILERLPDRLRAKLVDLVATSAASDHGDVVQVALQRFIEHEQQESFDAADTLCREVRRGEMAELGTLPSIEALRRGQADLLVMTGSYAPGRGWICTSCETVTNGPEQLADTCPCGGALTGVDLREHLVQLAERTGCGFERVSVHDQLAELGGVGCLLRYARPTVACTTPLTTPTPPDDDPAE